MDIRHLRAFARVYERKSFSRAGEDLYLSQPTISAHIASLEKELKVPVFDRLGRGILATPAADVLYAYCQKIFADLEQVRSEIRLLSDEVAGSLQLGASTIPANHFLPRLISRFTRMHAEVFFSLEEGDSSDIIRGVLEGRFNLGLTGIKEEFSDLVFDPLFEDSLVVLASPQAVADSRQQFSLADICAMPWVLRQAGSGTRRAMETAFEAAGLNIRDLHVMSVVDTTEALLRFVRCGLGITVSSRVAAAEELERGDLVVLNVPVLRFQRSFFVVHHRHRHQFPAARCFLDFILREASALGGEQQYAQKEHERLSCA